MFCSSLNIVPRGRSRVSGLVAGQLSLLVVVLAFFPPLYAETMETVDPPIPNPAELTVTARSLGYEWLLLEARSDGKITMILSQLKAPSGDMMVGMALEDLTLTFPAPPETTMTHFVLGSSSGLYEPPEDLNFIASRDDLPKAYPDLPVIWAPASADQP